MSIQEFTNLLTATPLRIERCTAGHDEARLHAAPGTRAWSAAAILAHLRACADVWTFSIYAMLNTDSPVLPLLDERRWAKTLGRENAAFAPSLQAFTLQRAELLQVLDNLPLTAWQRNAIIGGRTHTIFSQVRRMALHEVEHCLQLENLLTAT